MRRSFRSRSLHELVLLVYSSCTTGTRMYTPRISLPASARGIALAWTGVGLVNFSLIKAWRSRGSRLRLSKSASSASEVSLVSATSGEGTSLASNLRFIVAIYIPRFHCKFKGRESGEAGERLESFPHSSGLENPSGGEIFRGSEFGRAPLALHR